MSNSSRRDVPPERLYKFVRVAEKGTGTYATVTRDRHLFDGIDPVGTKIETRQ
jgi:hypothetical protein